MVPLNDWMKGQDIQIAQISKLFRRNGPIQVIVWNINLIPFADISMLWWDCPTHFIGTDIKYMKQIF